ncbi:MAG: 1,2-phenylacetyl-CoA epoxidase subunit PaaD [Bacteroidota bacterium]
MEASNTKTHREERLWQALEEVCDPEIPVLSILDLGIVREVHPLDEGWEVVITPTYSGCPAMNVIEINIKALLQERGFAPIKVRTILRPAWTTDWMTEKGKEKLLAYGIAPPVGSVDKNDLLMSEKTIPCPQCHSTNTEMISQFGSTACKSLYRCKDCLEPFDYFKCH